MLQQQQVWCGRKCCALCSGVVRPRQRQQGSSSAGCCCSLACLKASALQLAGCVTAAVRACVPVWWEVCLRALYGLLARRALLAGCCMQQRHWWAVTSGGVHRGRRGEENPGKGEAPHSTTMTNNQPKPHTCTARHTASSGAGHGCVLRGAAAMGCPSPPPTNEQPATHPHLLRTAGRGLCERGGWVVQQGEGRPRGLDIPTPNQHSRNHAYQFQSLLCLVAPCTVPLACKGRRVQPIAVPPLCLLSRPRVCLLEPP